MIAENEVSNNRRNSIAPLFGRRDFTRRTVLGAGGAALAGLAVSLAASSKDTTALRSDDTDHLQGLADRGDFFLAKREQPYVISRSIRIPAKRQIRFDEGVEIRYMGTPGTFVELACAFLIEGDGVSLVGEGRGAVINCDRPSAFVYAVRANAVTNLLVEKLWANNCQLIFVGGADTAYSKILTSGLGANISRRIRIVGGGAKFDTPIPLTHGACVLSYAFDWSVADCTFANVAHGVQWWGGNANPHTHLGGDGARSNERKCRNFHIRNVTVTGASGGGVWGSMGQHGRIEACTVKDCGDLGFDAEGSTSIVFSECRSEDGANGCFATFFACDDVQFVNCIGLASKRSYPLFRIYNETLSNVDNDRITITGGRFICQDYSGPGTFDTAMGPAGHLTIEGAEFNNVRIDTAFHNMHRTVIRNNRLVFPRVTVPFTAIRAGHSKSRPPTHASGGAIISGNNIDFGIDRLKSEGQIPNRPSIIAIELIEDDFNSSPVSVVENNHVHGDFGTFLIFKNASRNNGITPQLSLTGNVLPDEFSTERFLKLIPSPSTHVFPVADCKDNRLSNGRPFPIESGVTCPTQSRSN